MKCPECNAPICLHAMDAMIGHAGEVERVMEDNVRLREALRGLVGVGPPEDDVGTCMACGGDMICPPDKRHAANCAWAIARAALEGDTCASLNSAGQPQTASKLPTLPVTSPLTREDEDEISAACEDNYQRGHQEGVDAAIQGLRNIALRVTGIAARHWDDDHLCWCSEFQLLEEK